MLQKADGSRIKRERNEVKHDYFYYPDMPHHDRKICGQRVQSCPVFHIGRGSWTRSEPVYSLAEGRVAALKSDLNMLIYFVYTLLFRPLLPRLEVLIFGVLLSLVEIINRCSG